MCGAGDIMTENTLRSKLSSAELCRANGWGPGTQLIGNDNFGPTIIEITAVGERDILAKAISHNGAPGEEREDVWILVHRDWRPHESSDSRQESK